jgi:hypothetical protein
VEAEEAKEVEEIEDQDKSNVQSRSLSTALLRMTTKS